jgi:hypothetical protein
MQHQRFILGDRPLNEKIQPDQLLLPIEAHWLPSLRFCLRHLVFPLVEQLRDPLAESITSALRSQRNVVIATVAICLDLCSEFFTPNVDEMAQKPLHTVVELADLLGELAHVDGNPQILLAGFVEPSIVVAPRHESTLAGEADSDHCTSRRARCRSPKPPSGANVDNAVANLEVEPRAKNSLLSLDAQDLPAIELAQRALTAGEQQQRERELHYFFCSMMMRQSANAQRVSP